MKIWDKYDFITAKFQNFWTTFCEEKPRLWVYQWVVWLYFSYFWKTVHFENSIAFQHFWSPKGIQVMVGDKSRGKKDQWSYCSWENNRKLSTVMHVLMIHPNCVNHTTEGIIKILQTKRYNSIDMYPSYNMRVNLKNLSEIWQQGEGIGGGWGETRIMGPARLAHSVIVIIVIVSIAAACTCTFLTLTSVITTTLRFLILNYGTQKILQLWLWGLDFPLVWSR